MRHPVSIAPLVCGVASAVFCAAVVLIAPSLVQAQSSPHPNQSGQSCTCPSTQEREPTKPTPRPKFADLRGEAGAVEQTLALEAVSIALGEVADGASYLWHRNDVDISGVVTPVSSFKDADGRVCRHIVVSLSRQQSTRKTEGVACRQANGIWHLDG